MLTTLCALTLLHTPSLWLLLASAILALMNH
jgi:hypothetical protein